MKRLTWVRKRFLFGLALLGLAVAGYWYGIAHPPKPATLRILPLALPEMTATKMDTAAIANDTGLEPEPAAIAPDAGEPRPSERP